jgi:hypothetical protein
MLNFARPENQLKSLIRLFYIFTKLRTVLFYWNIQENV